MSEITELPDELTGDCAQDVAGYLRTHDGVLPENVKCVNREAFKYCKYIKKLVIPDSAHKTYEAFKQLTGLEEPVFNVSRTKLYRYPDASEEEEYTVPDGTEIIMKDAFSNKHIRRVVMPGSVREIENFAFYHCPRLAEIVIKNPDIKICSSAFNYCNRYLKVETPNPDIPDNCGVFDPYFLQRELDIDACTDHCSDPVFEELCRECGKGNADKMWELALYFDEKKNKDFYMLAANFWKYRAFMFGSSEAKQWFAEREITNPGEPLPSAHWERPYGNVDSDLFRALGFPFLSASVSYFLQVDDDGIVLAHGPLLSQEQDDFYHYEYYYDWYLLNEHFAPIEGVSSIHNMTEWDVIRSSQYKMMHERAVAALNGDPLPPYIVKKHEPDGDDRGSDTPIFRDHEDKSGSEALSFEPEHRRKPSQGWFFRLIDLIVGSDD